MEAQITAFAILMFILSQVSERITNLIKLNYPERWLGNLKLKKKNEELEKRREKQILVINLIAGLITTVIFQLSLGKDNLPEDLKWAGDFFNLQENPCGFICFSFITAIFVSFGAKFWHDFLDIVLEYKNIKKKIVDEKTYQIDNLETLKNHLKLTESQVADVIIARNCGPWLSMAGVVSICKCIDRSHNPNNYCIQITTESVSAAANIGRQATYVSPDNIPYTIAVNVIVCGLVVPHVAQAGQGIANQSNRGNIGTFGYVVKDSFNDVRLLTCYHVVRAAHKWTLFEPIGQETIESARAPGQPAVTVGQLVFGYINSALDIALVNITNPAALTIPSALAGMKKGEVTLKDSEQETPVKIMGMTSRGAKDAVVYSHVVASVKVRYDPGFTQELTNLFSLTHYVNGRKQCPTAPGDSGAIIYNNQREVLGYVVGGDNEFTYAIKLTELERLTGFTI